MSACLERSQSSRGTSSTKEPITASLQAGGIEQMDIVNGFRCDDGSLPKESLLAKFDDDMAPVVVAQDRQHHQSKLLSICGRELRMLASLMCRRGTPSSLLEIGPDIRFTRMLARSTRLCLKRVRS